MVNNCNLCGKKLGLFDLKFECRGGCNRVYCSECMETPKNTNKMRSILNFLPPDIFIPSKLETEYCFTKGASVACKTCVHLNLKKITAIYNDLLNALNQIENIEFYTKNYKGKIRYNPENVCNIESNLFEDREDVVKALKIIAVYKKHDIVFDVSWRKEKARFGNYIYTVWKGQANSASKI